MMTNSELDDDSELDDELPELEEDELEDCGVDDELDEADDDEPAPLDDECGTGLASRPRATTTSGAAAGTDRCPADQFPGFHQTRQ